MRNKFLSGIAILTFAFARAASPSALRRRLRMRVRDLRSSRALPWKLGRDRIRMLRRPLSKVWISSLRIVLSRWPAVPGGESGKSGWAERCAAEEHSPAGLPVEGRRKPTGRGTH